MDINFVFGLAFCAMIVTGAWSVTVYFSGSHSTRDNIYFGTTFIIALIMSGAVGYLASLMHTLPDM